jgi:hypothetical protein
MEGNCEYNEYICGRLTRGGPPAQALGNGQQFLITKKNQLVMKCYTGPWIWTDMKHGAFDTIPKANDKVCDGNTQHPHDPRKLTYWNHK